MASCGVSAKGKCKEVLDPILSTNLRDSPYSCPVPPSNQSASQAPPLPGVRLIVGYYGSQRPANSSRASRASSSVTDWLIRFREPLEPLSGRRHSTLCFDPAYLSVRNGGVRASSGRPIKVFRLGEPWDWPLQERQLCGHRRSSYAHQATWALEFAIASDSRKGCGGMSKVSAPLQGALRASGEGCRASAVFL